MLLIIQTILLVGCVVGLLVAHYRRSPDGQLFALGGWVSFIFFWLGMAGQLRSVSPTDAVAITALSPMFLIFVHRHWTLWRTGEEFPPLRWLTGTVGFTVLVYFLVERSPRLSLYVISVVTYAVIGLLNLFGFSEFGIERVSGGEAWWTTAPYLDTGVTARIHLESSNLAIIMACSALQGLAFLAAAFLCVDAPLRRRLKAVARSVPLLFFLNTVRLSVLIVLVDMFPDTRFGQMDMFELIHNWVAELVIFAALLAIFSWNLRLLPELHLNVRAGLQSVDVRQPLPTLDEWRSRLAEYVPDEPTGQASTADAA